jgi:primosomal protein N' (replication factor Y)
MRQAAGMPPFGRLAALIIEGDDEPIVQAACRQLVRAIPQQFTPLAIGKMSETNPHGERGRSRSGGSVSADIKVLGPAPAPLTRLRGRTRYRFLLKAEREFPIQEYLYKWLSHCSIPAGIRIKIDIDPYSFW